MVKKYENQGLAIITERTPHTDTPRHDIRIISEWQTHQAFSLTDKELNKVLEALEILNKRRFGTIK